jgi:hypothetical protein
MLAIPIAWLASRHAMPVRAELYVGTMALLLAGAILWGGFLGGVTMFHLFFGGIAVFATPIAAIGIWTLLEKLRETQHARLAAGAVVLLVVQLELGAAAGIFRMQSFGPNDFRPISTILLGTITQLAPGSKLAYTCRPLDEAGFADPSLLSIDAHTGQRVIPMCFQADALSKFVGAAPSERTPNPSFMWAPQLALYLDAAASPSPAEVAEFLKDNGIEYIYADQRHPNSLVPDAIPIANGGGGQILRIP